MPKHWVRQHDCLSSIARQHGLRNERAIRDHAPNASLRQERPNPNVLRPGDTVDLPELEPRIASADTECRHRYVLRCEPVHLRLAIRDPEGQPLADLPYRLTWGQVEREGQTDSDGLIDERIDAVIQEAELTVWPESERAGNGFRWHLLIGALDPVEETTGVQARLNNLGFDCGTVDGLSGPQTRAAVEAFQATHNLQIDGIVGPRTRAKLVEIHGS